MAVEAVRSAPLGLAVDADELESSRRLSRSALLEVTAASQLGDLVAVIAEGDDGVYTLQYETTQPGYPDWRWNVSLVRLADSDDPTVLEVELLPGEGSLLAPTWVPWSDRLADLEAAQLAEAGSEPAEDEDAAPAGDADGEVAPSDERSSKRIRRTRTRRRTSDVEPSQFERDAEALAEAPAGDDADAAPGLDARSEPADEKPKKKKAKKRKAAADSIEADTGVPVKQKKRKADRPAKTVDSSGEADDVPSEPATAEADAPESGAGKPKRRKRAKVTEPESAEAAAGDVTEPTATDEPRRGVAAARTVQASDETAQTKKKRRRVVVVPRAEDELRPHEPVEFTDAADIREFADDMDDVLDGVDFEPDADTKS